MRQQLLLPARDLQPFSSTFSHSSKSFSEAYGFCVDYPCGLEDDLFGRHGSSRLDKERESSSFLVIAVGRGRDRLPFRVDISSPEPGVCFELDPLACCVFHYGDLVRDRLELRILRLKLGRVYHLNWFRAFTPARERSPAV